MLPAEFSGYFRYWLMSLRVSGGDAHHALDNVGGQLLHHIDGIVEVELFENASELAVSDGVDDILLLRRVELGKDLCAVLLGEHSEHHRHLMRRQFREKLRVVELVVLLQDLLELLQLLLLKERAHLLDLFIVDRFEIDGISDLLRGQVLQLFLLQGNAPPFKNDQFTLQIPRYSLCCAVRTSMETPSVSSFFRATRRSISRGTGTTPGARSPRFFTRYSAERA